MKHYHIDIEELGQLWEAGWTVEDLSARYRCTETYICWLRKKYGMSDMLCSREPAPPSREDAAASEDSLALSPWVASRAAEFRQQKEARGESVVGGVYLRTYSLRTMTVVAD